MLLSMFGIMTQLIVNPFHLGQHRCKNIILVYLDLWAFTVQPVVSDGGCLVMFSLSLRVSKEETYLTSCEHMIYALA